MTKKKVIVTDFLMSDSQNICFFPRTTRPWNSPPIECFRLTYDLNGFKSRINRRLLTVGSF